ncbi:MAG: hypothetical protein RLY31_1903 [Bacteroidota bacterium]|jgi:lactoylglutathione lyase
MNAISLEHVAVWSRQPEVLRAYYETFFQAVSGGKYVNEAKRFESYFLTFPGGGARLEIMTRPDIPPKVLPDPSDQHLGIIHLAFGVETRAAVDSKAGELEEAGFAILSGPRQTGDGYYEFETLDPDGNRLEVTTAAVC